MLARVRTWHCDWRRRSSRKRRDRTHRSVVDASRLLNVGYGNIQVMNGHKGDALDSGRAQGRAEGEATAPTGAPLSRTRRRVLRTRAAIEDAFVALVLDRGLDRVSVEDVAERADVAKATFYAHYDNKEAVLAAVFARLTAELVEQFAYREGPWTEVRRGAVAAMFAHAHDMADLYRVCLAETHVRARYTQMFCDYAERNIRDRLAAVGRQPRIPVPVLARAFAGAHVAILEAWLDGVITGTPQEVAAMELDTVVGGLAWAHGLSLDEVGLAAPHDS